MKFLGALLVAVALLATSGAASAQDAAVRVMQGQLRGETRDDGTALFRGIPFARPPVGALRWRPPQTPRRWSGVRDALAPGSACAQTSYGWNDADARRGSEDCLYLDVRTPELRPGARLPVIVWLHGGSNRAGSGNGKVFSNIVDRGVVMVSVNYRLGPFGFLSHPALSAESMRGASGNYALMDQIAALRWVRANIARFGGDPRNVTIAGDSAGAQDVTLLLVAPDAAGLFRRVISQSGNAQVGWPVRTLSENEAIGLDLQRRLGAADLAAMRGASVEEILAADRELTSPTITDSSYLWLQTTVDGRVIAEPPYAAMRDGRANRASLLIGANSVELPLPGGPAQTEVYLALAFGVRAAEARTYYGLTRGDSDEARLSVLANDVTFRCPALATARLHARAGNPVYHYQFSRDRPGRAVNHGAELSVVMDDLPVGENVSMQAYWANFARTGDPNGEGLPTWPRYQDASRESLDFSNDGPTVIANLRAEACGLITY